MENIDISIKSRDSTSLGLDMHIKKWGDQFGRIIKYDIKTKIYTVLIGTTKKIVSYNKLWKDWVID